MKGLEDSEESYLPEALAFLELYGKDYKPGKAIQCICSTGRTTLQGHQYSIRGTGLDPTI